MSRRRSPPNIEGLASLKVGNISYNTRCTDLYNLFARFGHLGDVYIPRDNYTNRSRGFGFVRYYDRRDAEDALDGMDGRIVDGRELRVQMARYGRPLSPYRSRRRSRRSRSRSRSHSGCQSRSCSRCSSRSRRSRSKSNSHSGSDSSRRKSRSRSRSRSDKSRSHSK